MKNIVFGLITLSIWCGASIIGAIATPAGSKSAGRSADTCADSSLVVTYIQAFNPSSAIYAMSTVASFTVGITASRGGWNFQGDVFLAWNTPQNFTTPLYVLSNPTTHAWLVATSTNNSPPSVPGFTSPNILAYVYSSQVCGSVPLFGASNAAGSHFYTVNANDHSELISISGWTDAGIAAYVFPPSSTWYVSRLSHVGI